MSFARTAFAQSSTRCRMRFSTTASSFSPRVVLCVAEVDAQPEKMDTLAATPINSGTIRKVLVFGITWIVVSSFQTFRFASAPFRGQYPCRRGRLRLYDQTTGLERVLIRGKRAAR